MSEAIKEQTHFGYKTVAKEEKESLVKGVFERVADRYDVMNDVMSVGLHRLWKASLIDSMRPSVGDTLLDVAGGTGDIAFRFIESLPETKSQPETPIVSVCDINQAMLEVGMKRAVDKGYLKELNWICGSAEDLPAADQSFDHYSIAFGIRNVTNIDKALREAYRVLKPGGRFYCLEFSKIALPHADKIYDWYSFNIIPKMGEVITSDRDSYQYLVESIRQFPSQEKFARMITDAGFETVKYRNMSGGIVALHTGWRL